jgi:hypothetical protein
MEAQIIAAEESHTDKRITVTEHCPVAATPRSSHANIPFIAAVASISQESILPIDTALP